MILRGVLFLPVPIRQAGSCLLRTQMPTGAEPQLSLWISDGKPSQLELTSGNTGSRTQRKRKEAEEEADTDAASYSRNPCKRQPGWGHLPQQTRR